MRTLDELPPEARQRAEALLSRLPADWQVKDISAEPDERGTSFMLHLVDGSGQRAGDFVVYLPGYGVGS